MRGFLLQVLSIVLASALAVASSAALAELTSQRIGVVGGVHASSTGQNLTFRSGWFGTYIDTLNPFTTYSELSGWINFNTLLPLVHYNDQTTAVTPALASTWTVNYANHTVIFHLDPNAVWSDGVPVTSQDVVYSYNIAAQNYSFIEPDVAAVQNVTALSSSVVQITFTGSLWLWFAAIVFIVPAHVYGKIDPSTYPGYNSTGSQYFVGDGPYVITQYVVNQYATLQKNPRFFIPSMEPTLTTLIFTEFSSESSATSALQARQIDGLSGILPAAVSAFQNNSNFIVTTSPGIEYFYLAINVDPSGHGNPTLKDVAVRQALAHAVNLPYITQTVFHGYAEQLNTVLMPNDAYFDANISGYAYNPSLANQMLTAAGYNYGAGGVRVSSNGTALSYTVLVPSGDALEIDAAQIMAQNLSAVGIKLTVQAEDTGTMASTIWPNMNQDMDLWDWFETSLMVPDLLSVFLSNQVATGTSDSGFHNATYDALWAQLLNASSTSQVTTIANQMQTILHEQLPYLPLFVPSVINVYTNSFTGFNPLYPGGPFGGANWMTFINAQPSTAPAPPNYALYVAIGVVAVIVVAVAVVILSRRRKKE